MKRFLPSIFGIVGILGVLVFSTYSILVDSEIFLKFLGIFIFGIFGFSLLFIQSFILINLQTSEKSCLDQELIDSLFEDQEELSRCMTKCFEKSQIIFSRMKKLQKNTQVSSIEENPRKALADLINRKRISKNLTIRNLSRHLCVRPIVVSNMINEKPFEIPIGIADLSVLLGLILDIDHKILFNLFMQIAKLENPR